MANQDTGALDATVGGRARNTTEHLALINSPPHTGRVADRANQENSLNLPIREKITKSLLVTPR